VSFKENVIQELRSRNHVIQEFEEAGTMLSKNLKKQEPCYPRIRGSRENFKKQESFYPRI
jgi:hypothetical protein